MPETTKKPIKIVPNTIKTIPKIKPSTIIPKKTLEDQLEEIYDEINIDIDDLPDELLEVYEELEGTYKEKSIQKNWKLWLSMFTPFILPAFIKGVSGQVTLPYDARQSVQSNAPEPKVVVDYAKKYFEEHGLELVKTLSQTDCERLKVQLKDNWGKGPDAFKKSFQEDYANTKARLDAIYRTEYVTAQNEGILARSRDAGHKMKQWNAALDERTCPVCGDQLHGTIIPIEEEFSAVVEHKNGSEEISVNGPPAHPNCRCVLTTLNEEDYDEIKEDSAYLEDVFETIKLNYKCKAGTVDDSNKCEPIDSKNNHIESYSKILESKVPKKFGDQVYLVRMGSEKENNTNIAGNVFVGNNINILIKKALESSKESGNLIIGRCSKDAFEDDELDKISKNDFSVTSRYLGQSFSPVDVVIDTGTSDTIYKRSKDELEKEKNLFDTHELQLNKIEQNTALSNYRNFGYQSINNILRKNYVIEGENKKSALDPTPVYSKEYIDKALKDASLISDAMEPSKENKTLSRVDGAAITATLFPVAGITEELTNYFKKTYEKSSKYPKAEDILFDNIKPPSEKTWNNYLTTKLKGLEFKDPAFLSTSKSESGIKEDLLNSSNELSPYGIPSLLKIEVPKGTRLADMQERLGIGEGRYKTEKEVLLDKNTIFKIKSVKLEPHDNGIIARIMVRAIQKLPEPIKENSTSNNILVYFENSPIKSMDIAYLYDVVEYIKLNYKCPKGTVDDSNKCDIEKPIVNIPIPNKFKDIDNVKSDKIRGESSEFLNQLVQSNEYLVNSLKSYTNIGHLEVNKYLGNRISGNIPKETEKIIIGLDSIFNLQKEQNFLTSSSITTYRGVSDIEIENLLGLNQKHIYDIEPGKIITDPKFVSTTLNKEQALQFGRDRYGGSIITILIPKNSEALHTESVSGSEDELLINRNQSYKFLGVNKNIDNSGLDSNKPVHEFIFELVNANQKQNSSYLADAFETIKLNYNCPDSEKNGTGPGSCGGNKPSDSLENFKLGDKPTKSREQEPVVKKVKDILFGNSSNIQITKVHRDVPGLSWLEEDRAYAKERSVKTGKPITGTVTASFEGRLPIEMVKDLPGENNEHTNKDILTDFKAEPIFESIKNEGVKEPITIFVNHEGKAYISEGNHRTHIAAATGQKDIPVEVRYFSGGEFIKGTWNLRNFEKETPEKYIEFEKTINNESRKQDSAYLSDVTDFIKLNYKCPKGTIDDTNACGLEGHKENNEEFIGFKSDHDFSSPQDIEANKRIQASLDRAAEPLKKFSKEDRHVLTMYSGGRFHQINEYLNGSMKDMENSNDVFDKANVKESKQLIEKLDKLFTNSDLSEPLVTYRGISNKTLSKYPELVNALDTPGSEIEFPCFSSTSALPFMANNFTTDENRRMGRLLELQLPSGTKALFIAEESVLPNEFEILVNRGTKFKVVETRYTDIIPPNNGSYKDRSAKHVKITTIKAIV